MAAIPRKLWEHPDPKSTQIYEFMTRLNQKYGLNMKDYQDLYGYSVDRTRRAEFWAELFAYLRLIHEGTYARVVDESAPIDSIPRWFEGVRLSWVENLLWSRSDEEDGEGDGDGDGAGTGRRGTVGKEDDAVAVTSVREGGVGTGPADAENGESGEGEPTVDVTWGELRRLSARYAAALHGAGVRRGDRVVVVAANSVETLLLFNAASWLGALFSSSSTDMGVTGILQRTVQVNPKYIFMDDAALYNGKRIDLRDKMRGVAAGMAAAAAAAGDGSSCDRFAGMVSIRRFDAALDVSDIPGAQTLEALLERHTGTGTSSGPPHPPLRLAFHEPFLICYSSGTTGMPKAIVHSVGGVLLNRAKESALHEDTRSSCSSSSGSSGSSSGKEGGKGRERDDGSGRSVVLQYTTTGWIMYVVGVVAQLLRGARVVLYDGSPYRPDALALVRLLARQRVTKFGTSPRWLQDVKARQGQGPQGIAPPREAADLSALRLVTSTGMVLSEQLFEWFYDVGFPPRVHLANVSGGTDLAGCFAQGNPISPVYAGGTQGFSLGIPAALYDTELPPGPGRPVPDGTPGELVATMSFPSVPVFLWGDKTPAAVPGSKFHAAYFARYDHVWAHGDFCVLHPTTKNLVFLGRADGVLNPSGVRFGSAEIYSVIERSFADRVVDAICVGQRRPRDNDESVMLFLLMQPGHKFDRKLVAEIKEAIGREMTKRHVPKYVFETPEIPTTVNLKKVELPVKQIVSGQIIKPSGTLLNPDSLKYYYQFAKVEELVGPREKL